MIKEIAGKLRGYFSTSEIYIGGSFAMRSIIGKPDQVNDIDIFILQPRSVETWAMIKILKDIFHEVTMRVDGDGSYNIKNQYALYTCRTNAGVKYDIMFLDTDYAGLIETMSSDLTKLLVKVAYAESMLKPIVPNGILERLLVDKKCNIYKDNCTDDHLEKILARCILLNITPNIIVKAIKSTICRQQLFTGYPGTTKELK